MSAQASQSEAVGSLNTALPWDRACRAGGIAAFILIVYGIATMVQIAILGGPPATAAEAFRLLQQNKVVGLLRLDFPTVIALPLYYALFLGLFAALRDADRVSAAVSTALVFVGVTLVLAMPTALPMLALSQKYAAATTEAMRSQFLTAGEALLATDIWHGTGAFMGGVFVQTSAVLISVVMLRSRVFSKITACLGILMHGLDLAHIIFVPFLPATGTVLMIAAGPLYPIWLFLVGRRLLQLGRTTKPTLESESRNRLAPQRS